MQRNLTFSVLLLGAAAFTGHATAEPTPWFETEQNALVALSGGQDLDVFDCTQCDADNASHRITLSFIGHLLSELRAHEQPSQGAFVLRERVQPRYYVDNGAEEVSGEDEGMNLALTGRDGCYDQGWSPSLTRWEYDLDKDEARPAGSACLASVDAIKPIRMSCKGCDLEQLGEAADVREQLEAAYWALFEDNPAVTSGEIIVTDSVNSGFRRLDFRAYRDTVYLGPADGDYYVISLGSGSELAQQP